jgi:protein CpxP
MRTSLWISWRQWSGAALVLAMVAGAMPLLAAQDGSRGPRAGRFGRGAMAARQFGLGQLDLTDAQREQIRSIVQSHRDELTAIADRTRTARQNMQQASADNALDESSLRAASGDLATAMADGSVLRSRIRQEVFGVLTPDQLEKVKTLQANREQRRLQMRERIQERVKQRRENQAR